MAESLRVLEQKMSPAAHQPTKLGVLGLIDDTHAAFAKLLNDSVVGYGLANHSRALRTAKPTHSSGYLLDLVASGCRVAPSRKDVNAISRIEIKSVG